MVLVQAGQRPVEVDSVDDTKGLHVHLTTEIGQEKLWVSNNAEDSRYELAVLQYIHAYMRVTHTHTHTHTCYLDASKVRDWEGLHREFRALEIFIRHLGEMSRHQRLQSIQGILPEYNQRHLMTKKKDRVRKACCLVIWLPLVTAAPASTRAT